jgi:hypothetical protein
MDANLNRQSQFLKLDHTLNGLRTVSIVDQGVATATPNNLRRGRRRRWRVTEGDLNFRGASGNVKEGPHRDVPHLLLVINQRTICQAIKVGKVTYCWVSRVLKTGLELSRSCTEGLWISGGTKKVKDTS